MDKCLTTEKVSAIAALFDKVRGVQLDEYEESEILYYRLYNYDIDTLKQMLVESVTDDCKRDVDFRAAVYHALSKCYDCDLIPFFKEQLRLELSRDMHACYQLMIALGNLDEPVFAFGRTSCSSLDYSENRSDALTYLEKQ